MIGARVEVSSDGSFVVLRRMPRPPAAGLPPDAAPRSRWPCPGVTDIPWAGCGIDASDG